MGLMDELNSELREVVVGCPAERMLLLLPDDERDAIRNALKDPSIPVARILNVLRKNGYKLGDSGAYNHRNGICKCL